MFRRTTLTDKDVLINMVAELLRQDPNQLEAWNSLAFDSFNKYTANKADAKQQSRLMQQVIRTAYRFNDADLTIGDL